MQTLTCPKGDFEVTHSKNRKVTEQFSLTLSVPPSEQQKASHVCSDIILGSLSVIGHVTLYITRTTPLYPLTTQLRLTGY